MLLQSINKRFYNLDKYFLGFKNKTIYIENISFNSLIQSVC